MDNQNNSIGVNLLCVLLIVISFFYLLGSIVQLFMSSSIRIYMNFSEGGKIWNLFKISKCGWIVFYGLYANFAVLALKRKNMGRVGIISLSTIAIVFRYLELALLYPEGGAGHQYSSLMSLPYPDLNILIAIIVIYVFSCAEIKELFQ